MAMIKEGAKLPAFKLAGDDGKTYTNKDFAGKRTVIFIYPKDMTPGCTQEACDFRDNKARLARKKVEVVGLSKLDEKSKVKFKEKNKLNYLLLADPDQKYLDALGLIQPKVMYGKKVKGIVRTTLLVSPEGKIEKIWSPVKKVDEHVDEVIAAL